MSGLYICFSTCYQCKFGLHFHPPRVHSWGEPEDVEWARMNDQEDPGRCECACADPEAKQDLLVWDDDAREAAFGTGE